MTNIKTSKELNQEKDQNNVNQHNAFLIIPAYVTDNEKIDDATALLFGRLNALSNRKGYCFASNKYLAELTKVSEREIKRRLKTLADEGFIQIFTTKKGMGWDRKIYTCNNYSQIMFTKGTHGPYRRDYTVPIEGVIRSPYINKSINSISNKELASDDASVCVKYLFEKLKKLRPDRKEPNFKSWEFEMKRIIEIDKRTKANILKMIDWVFDTDNKFIVDSPASLRKKYDNIADHVKIREKENIKVETKSTDPKLKRAFKILDDYLDVINDGPLATNLSLRLEDKIIYHTTHHIPYKKTYEKFMEILKNQKAPFHLINRIEKETKNIN